MGSMQLPKVSKILSSRPISDDVAFQMISKFLEKEQRRLDPADLYRLGHCGDLFLVCEALSKTDKERSQLEHLRQSAPVTVKEEQYDESQPQPAAVISVAMGKSPSTSTVKNNPTQETGSHIPAVAESMAIKEEDVAVKAHEGPSSLEVKREKGAENTAAASSKRKTEKKAKKEKKKHRRHE